MEDQYAERNAQNLENILVELNVQTQNLESGLQQLVDYAALTQMTLVVIGAMLVALVVRRWL